MVTGRKPKPRALKIIEGNPGKRPIPEGLNLPPGAPGEPDWAETLPGDEALQAEAHAAWVRIVPDLDRMGLLSHIDRDTLTDYCCARALVAQCFKDVSLRGHIIEQEITRKDGASYTQTIRNPALVTIAEQKTEINRLRSELGLGPSSRSRLKPPGPSETDEDEAELFGG